MFIYLITNKINGKKYVGQTLRTPQSRFNGHKAHARSLSPMRIHAAMRKHGIENFSLEVLESGCTTQEQLDNSERFWISKLDTTNFEKGYNASPGGDSVSKESIEKRSAKLRGMFVGRKLSDEIKRKISESRKGKGIGHVVTSETRAKIGAGNRGKKRSEEERIRCSNLRKGCTNSVESNEKRSLTLSGVYIGERASMFGKKHSDATKNKMRQAQLAIGNKPPSWKGKKHSQETIDKMRQIALARLAQKQEAKHVSI